MTDSPRSGIIGVALSLALGAAGLLIWVLFARSQVDGEAFDNQYFLPVAAVVLATIAAGGGYAAPSWVISYSLMACAPTAVWFLIDVVASTDEPALWPIGLMFVLVEYAVPTVVGVQIGRNLKHRRMLATE